MTDHDNIIGEGAFGGEPARDVRLGEILREHVGGTPHHGVDWNALADRIAVRLAMPVSKSWWDYTARWERRAIPIALAAGVAGFMLLWNTRVASANAESPDLLASVVQGDSTDIAVRLFSRSITSTAVDIVPSAPE